MKRLCTVIALSFAGGCSTPIGTTPQAAPPASTTYATILVDVDVEGHLTSGGTTIADSDLALFAKEVGQALIMLVPQGDPDFKRLLDARNKLQAAGAQHVMLQGFNGG